MAVTVSFKAFDAVTGNELQGVSWYVDGVWSGDSAPLERGLSYIVTASKQGYRTKKIPFTASQTIIHVALEPEDAEILTRIEVVPSIPAVSLNVGPKTAMTDSNGVAVVRLPAGAHQVSLPQGSLDGYALDPFQIQVGPGKTNSFFARLVKQDLPVLSGILRQPPSEETAVSVVSQLAVDTSEQTPSVQLSSSYFTSAQCRVYINGLFLDELQSIQWVLSANMIPVFGYNSEFADAYARGKSQVQGQIVLNYVHPRYLYVVLDGMNQSKEANESEEKVRMLRSAIDALPKSSLDKAVAEGSVRKMIASLSAEEALLLKTVSRAGRAVYQNPVYLVQPFDMTVEIGSGANRTVRFLEHCLLISNEQIVAQDGNPIAEAYGFIARRVS